MEWTERGGPGGYIRSPQEAAAGCGGTGLDGSRSRDRLHLHAGAFENPLLWKLQTTTLSCLWDSSLFLLQTLALAMYVLPPSLCNL